MLLRVVLFAQSRGLASSRAIARACEEHMAFIAMRPRIGVVPTRNSSGRPRRWSGRRTRCWRAIGSKRRQVVPVGALAKRRCTFSK
ncbi:hypothetical protein [Gemmatimonas sp.]|uniref:hypothetical protein n=1 Tax=Gemmatimonas sp. TaxID=1962908 RepID=UPI0031B8A434